MEGCAMTKGNTRRDGKDWAASEDGDGWVQEELSDDEMSSEEEAFISGYIKATSEGFA